MKSGKNELEVAMPIYSKKKKEPQWRKRKGRTKEKDINLRGIQ